MMKNKDNLKKILIELISDLELIDIFDNYIDNNQSFILGADGKFLGRIINKNHYESILNTNCIYGKIQNDFCIFNPNSPYTDPNGKYSMNNTKSTSPPVIFIDGEPVCVISLNTKIKEKVITPENFIDLLTHDIEKLLSGEFTDSGGIRVPVLV